MTIDRSSIDDEYFQDPGAVAAKVVSITNLSPTVKGLTLKVAEGEAKPSFKAGQWLDFFIPGEATVGGFSMSSR